MNNLNALNSHLQLDIPNGSINTGQGEYIVFHSLDGERKDVERDTYEKVYDILNSYAPIAIVNRNSDSAGECENRYSIIKSKVKEIDPSLEIAFVPRTLYELIFIRKCIREDLKHGEICEELDSCRHSRTLKHFNEDVNEYDSFQRERAEYKEKRKCWHLYSYRDTGDNHHPGVRDVAYRLNRSISKKLAPMHEGFTYEKLSQFAESEIEFLKQIYCKIDSSISSCDNPGPTTSFGFESERGSIKPTGIRNDKDAQIIRNAIAMECSKIAQRAFLLYRGGNFQKDAAIQRDKSYSLSYGHSLFAGCLFDGGAIAFRYMRNQENAYVISVPYDQLNNSPFYLPSTNAITQLFGKGEIFHARTKAWKDFDPKNLGGISYYVAGDISLLKSELPKEEFIAQFQSYKDQAIQLKKESVI